MSGTSLDGVDAALVEFNGDQMRLVETCYRPMDGELRQELMQLQQPGDNELARAAIAGNALSALYAAAVEELLGKAALPAAAIRAIGNHGQTVRHRPELGFTIQLSNPSLLAELTGITVVADFRSRDIAAGGQGAPLVPAFHTDVFRRPDTHRVAVNIGGIANLTDLPATGRVVGFDCGPGNMLMDAWIERHQGHAYDRDGAWAASGQVLPALLARLLADPFFALAPPKSTGRDLFSLDWLQTHLHGDEAPADVQATLLELTARTIADAIDAYCAGAAEVYLCGGGAHNARLAQRLTELLPQRLALTDSIGINADWVEAFAFAWLARQTLHGHPANLPDVTGAHHPCILGAIYPA